MDRLRLRNLFSDNSRVENNEIEEGSISLTSGVYVNKVIVDCFFLGKTEIKILERSRIVFDSCTFESNIKFDLNLSGSNLVFNRCTFKTGIFIEQVQSIEIKHCTVEYKLDFRDLAVRNIRIYNTKLNKLSLGAFENNQPSNVQLDSLICDYLFINQKTAEQILISKGSYGKIDMNHLVNFKNIQFFGDEKSGDNIAIKTLTTKFLNLENSMVIKNALIDNWDVSHFNINNGKLRLQNVILQDSLISVESNLTGAQFNNVSFQTAKLFFDWSYIKEITFSNIIWPKRYEVFSIIEQNDTESKIQILRSKTEVYRQLKKASIDSNNQIDKLKFQRNELDTYWKRVKIDKSESRTNRFLLRIDRLFSNFGQDYLRPIAWLLGVQFILCCLIWWREDVYHNYDAVSYAKAFEDGLAQYVTMIIPVFKTPEYWTGTSLTLSVIIRLFNALLIYHFIRAVHKFGKN